MSSEFKNFGNIVNQEFVVPQECGFAIVVGFFKPLFTRIVKFLFS